MRTADSDATMSSLTLDCHLDAATINIFAHARSRGGENFLSTPHETPFIPRWSRVHSAFPEFDAMNREAVAAGNS